MPHTRPMLLFFTGAILLVLFSAVPRTQAGNGTLVLGAAEMCRQEHVQLVGQLYSAIFAHVQRDVSIRPLPLKRLEKLVESGKLDGDFLRADDGTNLNGMLVKVDEPVFDIRYSLYVTDPELQDISTLQRLTRPGTRVLQVGYIRGSVTGRIAAQTLAAGHTIYRLNTYAQGIDMLRAGRIDMLIGAATVLDCMLATRNDAQPAVIKTGKAVEMPGYIYLAARHADLAPRLKEAIRRMKQDGSFRALLREADRL